MKMEIPINFGLLVKKKEEEEEGLLHEAGFLSSMREQSFLRAFCRGVLTLKVERDQIQNTIILELH